MVQKMTFGTASAISATLATHTGARSPHPHGDESRRTATPNCLTLADPVIYVLAVAPTRVGRGRRHWHGTSPMYAMRTPSMIDPLVHH
jgi:hypothetical protein